MAFISGDMTEIVTHCPDGDIKVNMYIVTILVDISIRRPEGVKLTSVPATNLEGVKAEVTSNQTVIHWW